MGWLLRKLRGLRWLRLGLGGDMSAKKNIKELKECEYWDKKKGELYMNGKYKYRYIIKRTCRFWKRFADKGEL